MKTTPHHYFTVYSHPYFRSETLHVYTTMGSYDEIHPGVTKVLFEIMKRGNVHYPFEELNKHIVELGGDFYAKTTIDASHLGFIIPRGASTKPVSILMDLYKHPELTEEKLSMAKQVYYNTTAVTFNNPSKAHNIHCLESVLTSQARNYVFPRPNDYKTITLQEVKQRYQDLANYQVKGISTGNLSEGFRQALRTHEQDFQAIPHNPKQNNLKAFQQAITIKQEKQSRYHVHPLAEQVHITLNIVGPGETNKNALDFTVFLMALGGINDSLLFTRIREELGLSYQSSVDFSNLIGGIIGHAFTLCSPGNAEQVIHETIQLIEDLRTQSLDFDLEMVKTSLESKYNEIGEVSNRYAEWLQRRAVKHSYYTTPDQVVQAVLDLTMQDLVKIMNETFTQRNTNIFITTNNEDLGNHLVKTANNELSTLRN